MKTDTEIRDRLSQFLGSPLSDPEWQLLKKEGAIDKVRASNRPNDAAHDVVEQIRRYRKAFGSENTATVTRKAYLQGQDLWSITNPPRIYVVGVLLGADAQQYAPVTAFREAHLPGGLLEQGERLETWLWERARAETCELVSGHTPLYLAYLDHHDQVEYVPYLQGGVLAELKELAQELHRRYGWHEEEATTFVCCGRVPVPEEFEEEVIEREPFGAASRIIMTVDPALSPAALASLYQELRKPLVGQRHRGLNDKHRSLAWHHARYHDHTWQEQMRLWNEEQRAQWQYTEPWNFHRDSTWAARRLLRQETESMREESFAEELVSSQDEQEDSPK